MKKSVSSNKKGSSCLSFMTGISRYRDENGIELMRISFKKEMDRKEKLEKLLERYESIRGTEKSHIKNIKASIIELKDTPSIAKIRFLVDPNIYVDNRLSVDTKKFLCTLLNTFYRRYHDNSDIQTEAANATQSIKAILTSIERSQDQLFKMQKQAINQQVQLEGELLSEKAKLKEETRKTKDLETERDRVNAIMVAQQARRDVRLKVVEQLKAELTGLYHEITGIKEEIGVGEAIKEQNRNKMDEELVVQVKFQNQMAIVSKQIEEETQREKQLKKAIMKASVEIQGLKMLGVSDQFRHRVKMELLSQLSGEWKSKGMAGVGKGQKGKENAD